jgi:hypothetical protein
MAVLVPTSVLNNTLGNRYQAFVQLPVASNGDTYDVSVATPIRTIDFAIVVPNDTGTAAADSVSATWATSIVTLTVAGTARAQALIVWGRSHPVK